MLKTNFLWYFLQIFNSVATILPTYICYTYIIPKVLKCVRAALRLASNWKGSIKERESIKQEAVKAEYLNIRL